MGSRGSGAAAALENRKFILQNHLEDRRQMTACCLSLETDIRRWPDQPVPQPLPFIPSLKASKDRIPSPAGRLLSEAAPHSPFLELYF